MSDLLLSAAQVAANPDWRIFDCRHDLMNPPAGRAAYLLGHLPGAVHLHLDHDLSAAMTGFNGRHPLPDAEVFAARMAELGVSTNTTVVAYDSQGGVYASRLWWMLRWIGHENVGLLDGGLGAWTAAGYRLDTKVPIFQAGDLRVRAPANDLMVDANDVLANLRLANFMLVDARNADRFAGRNETIDPVAGHIPGAKNRFFQNNLDPTSGCFKSPEHLRAEFSALMENIDAQHVVHQCGSGVTACHNLFAMEIAGLAGSRLYPGSWSEWCSDPSRPFVSADTSIP